MSRASIPLLNIAPDGSSLKYCVLKLWCYKLASSRCVQWLCYLHVSSNDASDFITWHILNAVPYFWATVEVLLHPSTPTLKSKSKSLCARFKENRCPGLIATPKMRGSTPSAHCCVSCRLSNSLSLIVTIAKSARL